MLKNFCLQTMENGRPKPQYINCKQVIRFTIEEKKKPQKERKIEEVKCPITSLTQDWTSCFSGISYPKDPSNMCYLPDFDRKNRDKTFWNLKESGDYVRLPLYMMDCGDFGSALFFHRNNCKTADSYRRQRSERSFSFPVAFPPSRKDAEFLSTFDIVGPVSFLDAEKRKIFKLSSLDDPVPGEVHDLSYVLKYASRYLKYEVQLVQLTVFVRNFSADVLSVEFSMTEPKGTPVFGVSSAVFDVGPGIQAGSPNYCPLGQEFTLGREYRKTGKIVRNKFGPVVDSSQASLKFSSSGRVDAVWSYNLRLVMMSSDEITDMEVCSLNILPHDPFIEGFFSQVKEKDPWLLSRPWDISLYNQDRSYCLDGKFFTMGESFSYLVERGYDLSQMSLYTIPSPSYLVKGRGNKFVRVRKKSTS